MGIETNDRRAVSDLAVLAALLEPTHHQLDPELDLQEASQVVWRVVCAQMDFCSSCAENPEKKAEDYVQLAKDIRKFLDDCSGQFHSIRDKLGQ